MSGALPGGVSAPPYATGRGLLPPGSALLAVVTTGAVGPNQFALKFLGFEAGWRSRLPPYQLPVIWLSEKVELSACCGGAPPASRKTMPTVSLLVIWFSV